MQISPDGCMGDFLEPARRPAHKAPYLGVPLRVEGLDEVAPDEAGAAGDEDRSVSSWR